MPIHDAGGWFHPIHIHLIDMYVLARQKDGAFPELTTYESLVPKDVVAVHPGAKVAVLMRCVQRWPGFLMDIASFERHCAKHLPTNQRVCDGWALATRRFGPHRGQVSPARWMRPSTTSLG